MTVLCVVVVFDVKLHNKKATGGVIKQQTCRRRLLQKTTLTFDSRPELNVLRLKSCKASRIKTLEAAAAAAAVGVLDRRRRRRSTASPN